MDMALLGRGRCSSQGQIFSAIVFLLGLAASLCDSYGELVCQPQEPSNLFHVKLGDMFPWSCELYISDFMVSWEKNGCHRITEWLSLDRTSGSHFVQSSLLKQGHLQPVAKIVSSGFQISPGMETPGPVFPPSHI